MGAVRVHNPINTCGSSVVLPQGLLGDISIDNTRNCHLCHVKEIRTYFERLQLEDTRKQKKRWPSLFENLGAFRLGKKKSWFHYIWIHLQQNWWKPRTMLERNKGSSIWKGKNKGDPEVYCFTASKVRRSRDRSLYCNQRTFAFWARLDGPKPLVACQAHRSFSEKPCFVSCYLIILSKLTGPATS